MKRVQKGHVTLKWYVHRLSIDESYAFSLVLIFSQLGSRWSASLPLNVGEILSWRQCDRVGLGEGS